MWRPTPPPPAVRQIQCHHHHHTGTWLRSPHWLHHRGAADRAVTQSICGSVRDQCGSNAWQRTEGSLQPLEVTKLGPSDPGWSFWLSSPVLSCLGSMHGPESAVSLLSGNSCSCHLGNCKDSEATSQESETKTRRAIYPAVSHDPTPLPRRLCRAGRDRAVVGATTPSRPETQRPSSRKGR